jgi:hypothetical protein
MAQQAIAAQTRATMIAVEFMILRDVVSAFHAFVKLLAEARHRIFRSAAGGWTIAHRFGPDMSNEQRVSRASSHLWIASING